MSYDFNWRAPELQHDLDSNNMQVGLAVDNWEPRIAPPKTTMSGQYCKLEPFDTQRHAQDLYAAFALDTQRRNWAYMPYGPFESFEEFTHWCSNTCTGEDPLFHAIIDLGNNQATGVASYLRIAAAIGSIEVGHIHFSPLLQGTRLATEAMYLMMRRVFDELSYRRYEWKCNALNTPSCKAAERLGFQFEGIFRQATISKNRNRDTAWFSILDHEWPVLKQGFERWLAEGNFAEDGQQIKSLHECVEAQ
ncbi:MAG: GNAT family protein [Pseudomonadota bacterium]